MSFPPLLSSESLHTMNVHLLAIVISSRQDDITLVINCLPRINKLKYYISIEHYTVVLNLIEILV